MPVSLAPELKKCSFEQLQALGDERKFSEPLLLASLKARSYCSFARVKGWRERMTDVHNAAIRACKRVGINDTHLTLSRVVASAVDAQLGLDAREGLKPEEFEILTAQLATWTAGLREEEATPATGETQEQSKPISAPAPEVVTPEPSKSSADDFEIEL